MQDQLYQDIILEHWKDPQNFGTLKDFDRDVSVQNRYCGDNIRLMLKFDKNKISAISFSGEGCAISIASASIFTEYLKGKSVTSLKKINQEQVLNLLEIELTPARTKCALLIFQALQKALV